VAAYIFVVFYMLIIVTLKFKFPPHTNAPTYLRLGQVLVKYHEKYLTQAMSMVILKFYVTTF